MDVNMHIQFCGEPHDRIVIGMTACDAFFLAAKIFDPDAGAIPDPLLDLCATFIWKARVDGCTAREALFIPHENFEDLRVEGVWIKRLFQRAADLLSNGPLDAHALYKKLVTLVLL